MPQSWPTYGPPVNSPLSGQLAGAVDSALSALRGAADQAEAAAKSARGSYAKWLLGNESAISAAENDARKTRDLYLQMLAKRDTLVSTGYYDRAVDGKPGRDHAIQFIRDCGLYANVQQALDVARQTDIGNVFETVGSDTVSDLVDDAKLAAKGLLWGVGGIVALALAGVAVVLYFAVKNPKQFTKLVRG